MVLWEIIIGGSACFAFLFDEELFLEVPSWTSFVSVLAGWVLSALVSLLSGWFEVTVAPSIGGCFFEVGVAQLIGVCFFEVAVAPSIGGFFFEASPASTCWEAGCVVFDFFSFFSGMVVGGLVVVLSIYVCVEVWLECPELFSFVSLLLTRVSRHCCCSWTGAAIIPCWSGSCRLQWWDFPQTSFCQSAFTIFLLKFQSLNSYLEDLWAFKRQCWHLLLVFLNHLMLTFGWYFFSWGHFDTYLL